jgi:hypothetical protein
MEEPLSLQGERLFSFAARAVSSDFPACLRDKRLVPPQTIAYEAGESAIPSRTRLKGILSLGKTS